MNKLLQFLTVIALMNLAVLAYCQRVMNDPSKAASNTTWLQRQADAGDIVIPDGVLYINKRIKLPAKIGFRVTSNSGRGTGYWYPHDNPSQISAKASRIHQLTPGEPIFVMGGTGCVMDSLVLEGTGDQALIEVEGKLSPVATGHHRFSNMLFFNAETCFKALGGYYNSSNQFVADENHAEMCDVNNCLASNCKRMFLSQNQQAVWWTFRNIGMAWDTSQTPLQPITMFDIERGGEVRADNVTTNCPQTTIFRVKDFSPNTCYVSCEHFFMDRMDIPSAYLTLITYAGPSQDAHWQPWVFRFNGFVIQTLPANLLYGGPVDWPRTHWSVDMQSVYSQ